jgi:hypothetical protein
MLGKRPWESGLRGFTCLICNASGKLLDVRRATLFAEKPCVHFKNFSTQLSLGQSRRCYFRAINEGVDSLWAVKYHAGSSAYSSALYSRRPGSRVGCRGLVVCISNEQGKRPIYFRSHVAFHQYFKGLHERRKDIVRECFGLESI